MKTHHIKNSTDHNQTLFKLAKLALVITTSALVLGCDVKEKKELTLDELEKYALKVTVEGIDFDVPVLYHYEYYAKRKHWPHQMWGKRPVVDVLKFQALYPDLAPYSENNAKDFAVLGYGKKVRIYMTKRRVNWNYYFDGAFKRLIPLEASPRVPNMFRYRDPMSDNKQVYLSANKPVDKLIQIICHDPELDPKPPVSPSCKVQTVYKDHFDLKLTFSLEYLSQWREIDQKTQRILDSFIAAANESNKDTH